MRITGIIICALGLMACSANKMRDDKKLKYVALGDSYTCCEGATQEQSWPVILTRHLTDKGINIELTANPAVTGWTTQNLIDRELPLLENTTPDFVTLLIGVNDWVQGVDSTTFHTNLMFIIDKVQSKLANKKNLVLITIPDFGVTPTGANYSGGRDISKGISAFNAIIKSEVRKDSLPCVDIYPETQKMKDNSSLIAADGLHPSATEYAKWEALILPVAYNCLKGAK